MITLLDLSAFGFSFVVFHDKAKRTQRGNLLGGRRWHNPFWSLPKKLSQFVAQFFGNFGPNRLKREQGQLERNQRGLEIVFLVHKYKS